MSGERIPQRASRLVVSAIVGLVAITFGAAGIAGAQAAGDGRSALPGYVHTRVATDTPVGVSLRAGLAYGVTEALAAAPGAHHRGAGSLAVAGRPVRWLGFGLSLDGRIDAHPGDANDAGPGVVTRGAFEVRLASTFGHGLSFGVAAMAIGTGGVGTGLALDATSLEATALFGWAGHDTRIALEVGHRLDRSARAAPAFALSSGDRLALGLSSFDAVVVRLALARRVGAAELYLEGALDALVGAERPRFAYAPKHALLGVRAPLGRTLQLDAYVDVGLAARPSLPAAGPYVPVDPRVAVGLALAYRFEAGAADARAAGARGEDATPEDAMPGEDVASDEDAAPDAADDEGRTLRGQVLDDDGAPLVDAHLVLTIGERSFEAYTDGEGRFALAGLPRGGGTLRIDAVGHETQEITVGRGASLPEGAVRMQRASPHGTLRGTVEGFGGESVPATITVSPGEVVVPIAADGAFEIALAPGRYRLRIEAADYTPQTREVRLADGTVTIVHVELRRMR